MNDLFDWYADILEVPTGRFQPQIFDQLGRRTSIPVDKLACKGARCHFHSHGQTLDAEILIDMFDWPGQEQTTLASVGEEISETAERG